MWHLFSDRTGHSVPLGRHFFIQVLFRACISVSASAALHCGDPLGQKLESPHPPAPLLPGLRGQGEAILPLSFPVHQSSALMTSIFTWLSWQQGLQQARRRGPSLTARMTTAAAARV